MHKGTILIGVFLVCSACGVVKRGTTPWNGDHPKEKPTSKTSSASDDESTDTKETGPELTDLVYSEDSDYPAIEEIQQFLQLAYKDWKGTPYRLGGLGYDGIDCSAFMQVVFEDYLSLQIPRTTRKQLQLGAEVKKSESKIGDLVFFKTGRTTYHVGVMVNNSEFLHASTSSGVKLSDIDHPFWYKTYLVTKRIL